MMLRSCRPVMLIGCLLVLTLCTVQAGTGSSLEKHAGKASRAAFQYEPPFPVTGLVALENGEILLWQRDGRAQRRDRKGGWTPVFQLPVDRSSSQENTSTLPSPGILDVRPDGAGLLALTTTPDPDLFAILSLSADGALLDRWEVRNARAIDSASGERWAYTVIAWELGSAETGSRAGIVPLLPQGKLGEPGSVAPGQWKSRVSPTVVRRENATLLCYDADRTKAVDAPLHCERLGEHGWSFTAGQSLVRPPVCGEWLMIREGRELESLSLRSLKTGKRVGQRRFPTYPQVVCDGTRSILVGGERLELMELPSLKTRWRLPLGGARVAGMAMLNGWVVYQVEGKKTLYFAPRPLQPHP